MCGRIFAGRDRIFVARARTRSDMPDDDWGPARIQGETATANTATLDCALVTAGQSTGYMRWAGNDRSLFRCVITHVSHVSHVWLDYKRAKQSKSKNTKICTGRA